MKNYSVYIKAVFMKAVFMFCKVKILDNLIFMH